jgi:hypothetical protein
MEETRSDEADLAAAIHRGTHQRPSQSFGCYFEGNEASCALGAAYEGMYRLTRGANPVVSRDLFRLFDCLDYTIRPCPDGCGKTIFLAAMIVHLNDDHLWSRERIAAWLGNLSDH